MKDVQDAYTHACCLLVTHFSQGPHAAAFFSFFSCMQRLKSHTQQVEAEEKMEGASAGNIYLCSGWGIGSLCVCVCVL